MKRLKYRLLFFFAPLIALFLRILGRTIRWNIRYEFRKDRGKIYALWHGDALGLALYALDRDIVVLVSRFRDGELATRILHGLGFRTVRGSSEEGKAHKGGRTATKKLIELLKEGKNVAITVDGPKGPPRRVKKGVVFLAQKTGSGVIPVSIRFGRYVRLNTWDSLVIPLPFTRGEVLIGEELRISPEEDPENARRRLEEILSKLSSAS
ncbi:MAG: lysophospholipid acyltransferase family protein [Aquificae bacterium]|nr:lysophospholipid acyltransferase family protein [Aquificota bacterium]